MATTMPARISGYDNNHLYWSVRNGNNGFITLDTRKATKFGINRDDSESLHQHRKMIVLSLEEKTVSNYLH